MAVMTSDSTVRGITYNSGVNRDSLTDFGLHGVWWIQGAQYTSVYINHRATTPFDDTVGVVFKNNPAGGIPGITKFPTDSTGTRFDSLTAVYGWFQTYLCIRKGQLYYWGVDSATYGALQLLGAHPASQRIMLRPFLLGQPGGGRTITRIVVGNQDTPSFIVQCNDGSIWTYTQGSATPVQKSGTGTVTISGGVNRDCYVICTASDILTWGQFTSVFGLADGITTPTSILSTLTAVGVTLPIKEIANEQNCLALIDADDSLFVWGDNPMGEGGNGNEIQNYRTYKAGSSSAPFSWDFLRNQNLITTPYKMKGKFKNLCNSGNLAFYFWCQDLHNNWYRWGRNKTGVLLNGLEINNEASYPCWGDRPAPLGGAGYNPLLNYFPVTAGGPAFVVTDSLAPIACAGIDRDVTTTSDSLFGDLSFQQLTQIITTYAWTNISGPNTPTIVSTSSSKTSVTGLISGTYVFRLTVTNRNGQTNTDDVTLYVSSSTDPYLIRLQTTRRPSVQN